MTEVRDAEALVARIRGVHEAIRDEVVAACERQSIDELSAVVGDDAGDTLFAVDRLSEAVLLARFEELARQWPCLLVAEGLGKDGRRVLPEGTRPRHVEVVIIVDPIDGTRGLMYQKRPAWILTGVARGPGPCTLADIELAVQTEIPLVKQHLSDELWAVRGQGASAVRVNRFTREIVPLILRPSTAATLAHGFATIARFFPGNRAELAAIDDEVVAEVSGPPKPGKAQSFEDQYISSGGQLYELMAGHDRFVADLRPVFERQRAGGAALCCHPYDLCTELIARELGVLVTDEQGRTLGAPLDVTSDVGWIGYANASLKALIEPHLRHALTRRGLID